jgi:hypothetical protein
MSVRMRLTRKSAMKSRAAPVTASARGVYSAKHAARDRVLRVRAVALELLDVRGRRLERHDVGHDRARQVVAGVVERARPIWDTWVCRWWNRGRKIECGVRCQMYTGVAGERVRHAERRSARVASRRRAEWRLERRREVRMMSKVIVGGQWMTAYALPPARRMERVASGWILCVAQGKHLRYA